MPIKSISMAGSTLLGIRDTQYKLRNRGENMFVYIVSEPIGSTPFIGLIAGVFQLQEVTNLTLLKCSPEI